MRPPALPIPLGSIATSDEASCPAHSGVARTQCVLFRYSLPLPHFCYLSVVPRLQGIHEAVHKHVEKRMERHHNDPEHIEACLGFLENAASDERGSPTMPAGS